MTKQGQEALSVILDEFDDLDTGSQARVASEACAILQWKARERELMQKLLDANLCELELHEVTSSIGERATAKRSADTTKDIAGKIEN